MDDSVVVVVRNCHCRCCSANEVSMRRALTTDDTAVVVVVVVRNCCCCCSSNDISSALMTDGSDYGRGENDRGEVEVASGNAEASQRLENCLVRLILSSFLFDRL